MIMRPPCGGCQGLGAHQRYCPVINGHFASSLYEWSQQADGLADTVGSNEPGAANLLYSAAARLREAAEIRAQEFKEVNGV